MERDAKKFPYPSRSGDTWYSELQVMRSPAGFYFGRTCWVEEDGMAYEDMGSRESGYYRTEQEARAALDRGEFRDCMENTFAYAEGSIPPPPGTTVAQHQQSHREEMARQDALAASLRKP